MYHSLNRFTAVAALVAFMLTSIPYANAGTSAQSEEQRAIALLNSSTCGAKQVAYQQIADTPTPAPTPSPVATPTPVLGLPGPHGQLVAQPTASPGATPPPVPTASPNPSSSGGPIFVVRGAATAPDVPVAGTAASPVPVPSGAPTLAPGTVAILSDQLMGNVKAGQPGDVVGNVHIFYNSGELVGDRAHYDGLRTVTLTGHPFLIDRARDSVLSADVITFDTVDQTAVLSNGIGVSNEGVERGRIHFKSKDLHTDPQGIGHGTDAFVSTCENPRGGYHLTGKTITYYPGDKIVITKVIMWLGAAAIFFLPQIVIPLRTVDDETRRPQFFPLIGYDQAEGFYVKTKLGFGKDQYYYGYYRVEYFTKVGLGLGYVGFYSKKNGRRTLQVNYYGIHDRRVATTNHNITLAESENISPTLKGQFNFSYTSAYGSIVGIPTNASLGGTITHTSPAGTMQTYTFQRTSASGQSSSQNYSFADSRNLRKNITQSEHFTYTKSSTNFGGLSAQETTASFQSLTSLTTPGANYQLNYDRSFSKTPSGYYRLPELQIHPNSLFKNIGFPVTSSLTLGNYDEPQTPFSTSAAQATFGVGPILYRFFGSDLSFQSTLQQDYFGTGDEKGGLTQNITLTTPVGNHVLNVVQYGEANYAGPSYLPFNSIATQSSNNYKNATDILHIYNQDYYVLSLNTGTSFQGIAQAVSYQLTARPTSRAIVVLAGSMNPGQGFTPTNLQLATPLGHDMYLAFQGDIDWKRNNGWLINKTLFLSKVIGECYEIKVQYVQSTSSVNVVLDVLAFPSHAAGFGIGPGQGGQLIPSTVNF